MSGGGGGGYGGGGYSVVWSFKLICITMDFIIKIRF